MKLGQCRASCQMFSLDLIKFIYSDMLSAPSLSQWIIRFTSPVEKLDVLLIFYYVLWQKIA